MVNIDQDHHLLPCWWKWMEKNADCTDVLQYFADIPDYQTYHEDTVFGEYFDCSCTGNFSDAFAMHCSLQDYCFTNPLLSLVRPKPKVCIHANVTHYFQAAKGDDYNSTENNNETIGSQGLIHSSFGLYKRKECIQFLQGGPGPGNLCVESPSPCEILLKLKHGYGKAQRNAICRSWGSCNATFGACESDETFSICQDHLEQILNYTNENAAHICPDPHKYLNDMACKDAGSRECDDFEENEPAQGGFTLPDCSNIAACATAACQPWVSRRYDPTPGRIIPVYLGCVNNNNHTHYDYDNNVTTNASLEVEDQVFIADDDDLWDAARDEAEAALGDLFSNASTSTDNQTAIIHDQNDITTGQPPPLILDEGEQKEATSALKSSSRRHTMASHKNGWVVLPATIVFMVVQRISTH